MFTGDGGDESMRREMGGWGGAGIDAGVRARIGAGGALRKHRSETNRRLQRRTRGEVKSHAKLSAAQSTVKGVRAGQNQKWM
jgi:hypothetical protein